MTERTSPLADFFARQRPYLHIWVAIGIIAIMFAISVGAIAFSVFRERDEAQARASERALAASLVVSTNARWIVELSRQALARVDEALGPNIEDNIDPTTRLIRQAVSDLPGNVKTYVVAADGRTLFSTDPKLRPTDIRDREYFASVAAGAQFHVSSLLVSRLDGTQIFVFSKRIERNGKFVAAAIISFDAMLLKEIWDSVELDAMGTVSLVRDDGQLVARYPLPPKPLDLKSYPLFTVHLKASDFGAYPSVSPSDGVTRIVGYRKVPGTNLIALASVSTASAFATFERNRTLTVLLTMPFALALLLAAIWIFRLLRREGLRNAQLTEALALNRMLVRDTHHRVKNNLQAIMSLVRMHPVPPELKGALQSRVAAMSAVHEHLYRFDQFTDVNAVSLLPAIVGPLIEGFGASVNVSYDIDAVEIDTDLATPLSLVVNEVVTNSLKYAFEDGREGRIRIALKTPDKARAVLTIADNGPGFDATRSSSGLGQRLIGAMIRQLGGTFEYVFEGGTTFRAEITVGKPVTRLDHRGDAPDDKRLKAAG